MALILVYEKAADYHQTLRKGDPAKVKRRGKSKCAGNITMEVAQRMLAVGRYHGSLPGNYPKSIFSKHEGVWYQANSHAPGRYHGFPVPTQRVPPTILRSAGR